MNKRKAKALRKKVFEKFDGKNPDKYEWTYKRMKKAYKEGRIKI